MQRFNPWRQALGLLTASLLWACSAPGSQPEGPTPSPPVRQEAAAQPVLESVPMVSAAPVPAAPPPRADLGKSALADAPRAQELRPAPPPAAPAKLMAQGSHALMAPRPPMPPPQPDTAKYTGFQDNPWQRVAEQPVSTFSASVDTGSYANVRRFLNRGQLPPRDAVRVEELVNYFGYADPLPAAGDALPLRVTLQQSRSPWHPERGLLRIGIQGRDTARATLPPANLVFLVDVSGSMGPPDRLPLVRSSLQLLAQQLRPQDRVSLVSYANGTQVVLPATAGDRQEAIRAAIQQLAAGGGTYGEAGIRLAYAQACAGFIKNGINRVLLATDGDLNIGVTDPKQLKALVEEQRQAGIGLTTLGVGDSNYNEALMKQLADAGDGSYHYLDSLQEAHKVLVQQMRSTLEVIAKDLKLQIEFNPAVADEYRLIGYELHQLQREDFNNDRVDAGEIGAGHRVTALYEWVPKGGAGTVDPLRYQGEKKAGGPANELAWLKLRFKHPGQSESVLHQLPVPVRALVLAQQADAELRWAAAVAGWGQWLRGSTQIGGFDGQQALSLARTAVGEDAYGHRAEALRLMTLSTALKTGAPKP
ncbi:vWA domain-containing protein [Inhella proteolytica]|uniref:VWA domain-containing protein n=1 Tax=Inhella proteolytica TaxID=2795029 RepID=A0A931NJY9_9BURK|nr:VWA domain-containing protein [Inhella proteolytica]MBH9579469.1 VWA domain-containing protein [Inhella proteolytica]